MATSKTTKSNLTAKAPTEKAVQTTLKVETEAKKAATAAKTPTPVVKKEEKPVEKKTVPAAEKKPEARKTTRKIAAKRTTKKAAVEVKPDIFVQFAGMEYSEKAIMSKVVAKWEAEGKKASAIKRIKLYVKPEDGKAYYVINEKLKNGSTGAVDL